jgi:hypothetical protein
MVAKITGCPAAELAGGRRGNLNSGLSEAAGFNSADLKTVLLPLFTKSISSLYARDPHQPAQRRMKHIRPSFVVPVL